MLFGEHDSKALHVVYLLRVCRHYSFACRFCGAGVADEAKGVGEVVLLVAWLPKVQLGEGITGAELSIHNVYETHDPSMRVEPIVEQEPSQWLRRTPRWAFYIEIPFVHS